MTDQHLKAIDETVTAINQFIIVTGKSMKTRHEVVVFFSVMFPTYIRDILRVTNPYDLLPSDARTMFRAVNPHLTELEQGYDGGLSPDEMQVQTEIVSDYFDGVQEAAIVAMNTTGNIHI